jgi:hypothetical protein
MYGPTPGVTTVTGLLVDGVCPWATVAASARVAAMKQVKALMAMFLVVITMCGAFPIESYAGGVHGQIRLFRSDV